jgi:dipeptidyl aminopeptidase/acylaminoacyl peptidase
MFRQGFLDESRRLYLDWSVLQDVSADGKFIAFNEGGDAAGATRLVFLRKTDGSPAVLLGEGNDNSLSPDGKWAVISTFTSAPQLLLVPTGAGETRQITNDDFEHHNPRFSRDGRQILFTGGPLGSVRRCYLMNADGTSRRPVTPEGITGSLSPDGKYVAAIGGERRLMLFPTEEGETESGCGR